MSGEHFETRKAILHKWMTNREISFAKIAKEIELEILVNQKDNEMV